MLKKIKDTKWLKLFVRTYRTKSGKLAKWFFCSRKDNPDEGTDQADAIVIVPFLENGDIVLLKQKRPALKQYVIENVAGLHDQSNIMKTARKEVYEETGLLIRDFRLTTDVLYNSIGVTDETCSYVFCRASGTPTTKHNDDSEDIEVIILDREGVKQLLHTSRYLNQQIVFSAKCWLILRAYANGYDWYEGI